MAELSSLCPYFSDTIIMHEAGSVLRGYKLKMKETAIATSIKFYQSFRDLCDPADDHDYQLAAMACLSLGVKVQEVRRCRLSDIVNTYHRYFHPDKPKLKVGHTYWRLKESLAKYEFIVLRVINFDINHELPHKYLLQFLVSLSSFDDQANFPILRIFLLSWAFLQDSFHTTLNNTFEPVVMATAVLYLAVKCCNAKIPEEGSIWKVLCPSTTEDELMNISTKLMNFYNMKNSTNSVNTKEMNP